MFGFGSKKILNRFEEAVECMNYWVDLYDLPFYAYVDGNDKKTYCLKVALEPTGPNVNFLNSYRELLVKCSPLDDGMTEKVKFASGYIDRFTLVINDFRDNQEYINDAISEFRETCKVLNELL